MKVTILTENTVYRRGYLGEHGLSLLIENNNLRYLFDTGQSLVFLKNAVRRKVSLTPLDGIILSHGHYDHCGGLGAWILEAGQTGLPFGKTPIYVGQNAFRKKYAKSERNNELREIGIPWRPELCGDNLVWSREGVSEIAPSVYLISGISYMTGFEPFPGNFCRDTADMASVEPDGMEDEQLLVIRTGDGLSVFAGCAHAGIVNCLSAVRQAFPGEHVYSVVAGMHLKGCGQERLERTIAALREFEVDIVVPLHCTGIRAIGAMKESLKDRCMLGEVGACLSLERRNGLKYGRDAGKQTGPGPGCIHW